MKYMTYSIYKQGIIRGGFNPSAHCVIYCSPLCHVTLVILITTHCATVLYCGITAATAQCCAYCGALCIYCGLLTDCCAILRRYCGVLRRYCTYCRFLCIELLPSA